MLELISKFINWFQLSRNEQRVGYRDRMRQSRYIIKYLVKKIIEI